MFFPTSRKRDGSRNRWPTRSWTKPAWRPCQARRLANSARAICASAWPIRSRICSRRSTGWISGRTRTSEESVPMQAKKRPAHLKKPKASRPHAPGYGFPEGSKGLLPWSWAEQRLKKSHNYWITTVRPDGSPHTMVVWGLWQDGLFLFSTGSKSRKSRNLAQNPSCIVCTEDANEAVIVEGVAEVADLAARRKLI